MSHLTARRPPHSPIAWLGGKSRLAARIVERLPEHRTYCEPFGGGGWVLFRKPESGVEILNDINKDLVTLYRCIKHHLTALIEQFRWMLVAREEFARFYYINKASFGAKMVNPTFGAASTTRPRLNLLRLEEELSAAHLRLSRVLIECRPYGQIIERFDKPETLFYLDPPYWDCEAVYGKGIFGKEDFQTLADLLSVIHGRFILSINDTPEIRAIFGAFRLEEVRTTYSISAGKTSSVGELLVSNFEPGEG